MSIEDDVKNSLLAIKATQRQSCEDEDVAKAFQLGLTFGLGEWIPCSERLPEIHQDVILSLRSLDVEVGYRAETEPYFYCHGADGCYIDPKNILAWMPLPKPYKEEKE